MNNSKNILLPIGRQSNGELFFLDILKTPNIFISYSELFQLDNHIRQLTELERKGDSLMFYLAVNSKYRSEFKNILEDNKQTPTYFFDKPFRSKFNKKPAFINAVFKEFSRREHSKKSKNGYSTILIIIDDVWNLIVNQSKSTGLKFLDLLLNAHQTGIHFIIASPTTYRNLLQQIIEPDINQQKRMKRDGINFPSNGIESLGAEIIYTTENLVFYKEQNSMNLQRLYNL